MTDWLPVVGVALVGIFTTLGLLLKGLREEAARERAVLAASRAFWITVVVTGFVYGLYLVFDERWIWY